VGLLKPPSEYNSACAAFYANYGNKESLPAASKTNPQQPHRFFKPLKTMADDLDDLLNEFDDLLDGPTPSSTTLRAPDRKPERLAQLKKDKEDERFDPN
jgi:hypothetical protein